MFWDYNSWKEIERVRRDVEKALNSRCSAIEGHKYPPVNLYESKDNVMVTAEMPGVSRDSVTITLEGNIITVSGTVIDNVDAEKYAAIRKERAAGTYEKQIRIPQTVDHNAIGAALVDGILTITLPKTEAAKPKQIVISE
jgi:HSP20 family protein